ncbi:MAG: hypothetical protein ACI4A8_04720 [Muribaculaceae bacterium]
MNRLIITILLSYVTVLFPSHSLGRNYFVKADATSGNAGTSWFAPMNIDDLCSRLNSNSFADDDVICFAEGVYKLSPGNPITITNSRITLRGGFPATLKATNIPDITYPSPYPTIITGDTNGDGTPSEGDCPNAIIIDNGGSSAQCNVVIKGLNITGCFFSGDNGSLPGAIRVELTNGVTISNCIISANGSAAQGPAGVMVSGSDVHLVDCILTDNHALSDGAAIGSETALSGSGSTIEPNLVIERCQISGNSLTYSPNASPDEGERLYNGIILPKVWPPHDIDPAGYGPMKVPYLDNIPQVIPINVGRQLFFDDFLIAENNGLQRIFYSPVKYSGNPILKAETDLEMSGIPGATAKDGGVWWNQAKHRFEMWYEAGWLNAMAFAYSLDGITWVRDYLGEGSINQIFKDYVPNSCSVVADYDAPQAERFKMFLRQPNADTDGARGITATSADGIHWNNIQISGPCGDRSTMFYNPFRKKFVFSLRSDKSIAAVPPHGRARYYREVSNISASADWTKNDPSVVFWSNADSLDLPDPQVGIPAELYNLDAVAYESIMLGMHQIFVGPQNDDCKAQGIPKRTDLKVSFSRDGFHWQRPYREPFIPSARTDVWDKGYVQCVGGICSVVGDQLRFYYIGFRGDESKPDTSYGMHSWGATGVAVLRRDGFCSLSGSGYITTRKLNFNGKYLFVNVDSHSGSLRAEILDADGNVAEGFSKDDCTPISLDSTIAQMQWNAGSDLSQFIGKNISIRFYLSDSHLFSFWISPSLKGESRGYVAGGGPGYATSVDNEGSDAYCEASNYNSLY